MLPVRTETVAVSPTAAEIDTAIRCVVCASFEPTGQPDAASRGNDAALATYACPQLTPAMCPR